jgi:hypothetical protein
MISTELAVAQRIAAEARQEIPAALLEVGGRALYSPASTLVSGSPYYFLGANPGEVASATNLHAIITVDADLKRLEEGRVREHGYLDEQWKNYLPGNAPIQVRGKQLFALLAGGSLAAGVALLRVTPTSNFILQRSPNIAILEQRVGLSALQLAQQYWPFHRAVIQQTGCLAIVTHAIGLARHIARWLRLGEGYARPSGWGGTLANCYAWRLHEGQMLLAVPNLSRYIPDGPRQLALSAFFHEFGAAGCGQSSVGRGGP